MSKKSLNILKWIGLILLGGFLMSSPWILPKPEWTGQEYIRFYSGLLGVLLGIYRLYQTFKKS